MAKYRVTRHYSYDVEADSPEEALAAGPGTGYHTTVVELDGAGQQAWPAGRVVLQRQGGDRK